MLAFKFHALAQGLIIFKFLSNYILIQCNFLPRSGKERGRCSVGGVYRRFGMGGGGRRWQQNEEITLPHSCVVHNLRFSSTIYRLINLQFWACLKMSVCRTLLRKSFKDHQQPRVLSCYVMENCLARWPNNVYVVSLRPAIPTLLICCLISRGSVSCCQYFSG
jgi:hypothetical protein